MPQAKARTQIPQAFPLSHAEIDALGPNGGIHLITLREEEEFTPRVELRPLPNRERIATDAVTVHTTSAGVHLRYGYSKSSGAPDRSRRPPIEFDVATGRRARIAYNGRFSGYSIEWLYRLCVVTLAVGIVPSADLFTGDPDHKVEDLAELF